ncbi:hypothetical protein Q7P37_010520 [Cladosporium fusiforme]
MNSDRAGPSGRFINLPFMRHKDHSKNELHLPLVGYLPNRVRNHFVAMIGEFVGTFLFLFFAFSATQVANASATGNRDDEDGGLAQVPNASALLYISLGFGFSLAVNAWVFFRVSGGLFNPAVTLGMALIGAVGWVRAGLIFVAQILGSMASAGVVSAMFPGPMNVSTTLGGNTSVTQGLFIEMFLTAQLVIAIFLLAAEKHKGTFLAPVGIGLSLFIAELSGVYFTGGSLNPARSFGPCVVLHTFPGYHWIYWVGPALGSLVAVLFYRLIKILEYETANPGQDFNQTEAEVFQFDEDNAARGADVLPPTAEDMRVLSQTSRDHDQIPGSGGRADGATFENRLGSLSSSKERSAGNDNVTAEHRANLEARGQRPYHAGPDAERGDLGGNYTVSGLRTNN